MKTNTVAIDTFPIRLGQFLKVANLVSDGLEAKTRIQNEGVRVNGELSTQRGKKLYAGDEIELDNVLYCLIQT